MRRGWFPPYYPEVVLLSALLGTPAAYGMAQAASPAPTPEPMRQAPVASTQLPLDDEAVTLDALVPETQTIHKKSLAHDIVIEQAPVLAGQLDLSSFAKTVSAFERDGYRIGVVICDLGTGATFSYNADEEFYPASSIKGPYVVSLYERLVDTGKVKPEELASLAEATIVASDNDAYHGLIDRCGSKVFADWAVSCRAIKKRGEQYDRFATHYYPDLSASQLATMWRHIFVYLDGGSKGAQELVGLFQRRLESPIREGVDPGDLTITKAGWYPADNGERYAATADAGIVLDGTHGYVVVIMTDIPSDLDALARLVPGVFSARASLTQPL